MRVCNTQYQELGADGVSRHLELDPETGATVLVEDSACRAPSIVKRHPYRSGPKGPGGRLVCRDCLGLPEHDAHAGAFAAWADVTRMADNDPKLEAAIVRNEERVSYDLDKRIAELEDRIGDAGTCLDNDCECKDGLSEAREELDELLAVKGGSR